jgi:hypothetical protein
VAGLHSVLTPGFLAYHVHTHSGGGGDGGGSGGGGGDGDGHQVAKLCVWLCAGLVPAAAGPSGL